MNGPFESLPPGWQRTRLDHVASVSARIGWKALTAAEYQPEGIAFLSTPNIKGRDIDFTDVNFISDFRYEESPELKLQEGDVLLAKDGSTLGITNVVSALPRPSTVNGSIAVLRPRAMVPRFLRYALASDVTQGRIQAVKDGMGVPHLFQADIKKFPLPEPPVAEQRAIADYLDTETARIDALIALKERMLDLVRLRLTAVIDSLVWGAGESEWGDGSVPRGWSLASLSNVVVIAQGQVDPRVKPFCDLRLIAPNHIESGTGRLLANETAAEQGATSGKYECDSGDIIYSKIRPALRKAAIAPSRCLTSADMYPMKPIGGLNPEYLLYLLLSNRFTELVVLESDRVAMPKVNRDSLGMIRVPVPPLSRQAEIVEVLSGVSGRSDELAEPLRVQVGLLRERRQALVTAAVMGGLKIPGVAA